MGVAAYLRLACCKRGTSAVEFALVLPPLAALLVGGIYTGILMYSAAGLHTAVEEAARCYAVNSGQCGSSSAAQTYAQNQYYGMNSPTFTASTPSCGHQVSASVTIAFTAVVTQLSVPLSATACYP
jgi:Flp pilus assembly protein TadG